MGKEEREALEMAKEMETPASAALSITRTPSSNAATNRSCTNPFNTPSIINNNPNNNNNNNYDKNTKKAMISGALASLPKPKKNFDILPPEYED